VYGERFGVVLGLELLAHLAEVRVVARDGDAFLGRAERFARRSLVVAAATLALLIVR